MPPFDVDNTLLRKILAAIEGSGGGGIPAAVQTALNLKEDVANKSTDTGLGNSDVLYPSQAAAKAYADSILTQAQAYTDELTINHGTLTYDANTVIDFTATTPTMTETLTGDVSFTTTNRVAGRAISVRLIAGASIRTLTFPGTWKFFGSAAPATLAANKEAVLTVTAFGANEADVRAAYAAEP